MSACHNVFNMIRKLFPGFIGSLLYCIVGLNDIRVGLLIPIHPSGFLSASLLANGIMWDSSPTFGRQSGRAELGPVQPSSIGH